MENSYYVSEYAILKSTFSDFWCHFTPAQLGNWCSNMPLIIMYSRCKMLKYIKVKSPTRTIMYINKVAIQINYERRQ